MKLTYDNELYDDLISVMTDGCYFRITNKNKLKIESMIGSIDKYRIKHERTDEKGVLYSLGFWKYEILKGYDLVQKFKQTVKVRK